MPEDPPERSAVNVKNAFFNPARASLDPVLLDAVSSGLQQPRAHQGSERQRHQTGSDDSNHNGNAEFTKDAAHKPGHEDEREKNRRKRYGHRKNGKADFLGAVEGRLERRLALLQSG